MERTARNDVVCQICHQPKPRNVVVHADLVRPMLVEQARKTAGGWSPDGYVCLEDLDRLRVSYVRDSLEAGRQEVTALDEEVLSSLSSADLLSRNVNAQLAEQFTLGERVADRVASFGGSWRFIMLFGGIIVVWIAVNSAQLLGSAFDPFPFILLNLVLSCLAALQAPVIMMSQNRQEARDRLRAENDYLVNLKAELEIRMLMLKVDGLLNHQWQRLLEIQEVQTELLEEMRRDDRARPNA